MSGNYDEYNAKMRLDDEKPEFKKAQEEFEPEWIKEDGQHFPGAEPEQRQVQRSTMMEKKHKEFYKQELREAGPSFSSMPPPSHAKKKSN